MTILNKQGVLMDKWFKTPNALVDDITGDVISPQAAAILSTILRLTEGVRGREWASIPHTMFMRKTQAKRRETIAKYVKELTDSDLIQVKRQTGKVTAYSINWKCGLWYSIPVIDSKSIQSVPVRFIRTCTLYPYTHVRLIRTGQLKTCTFHPYTYKDKETKDNLKDKDSAPPKKEIIKTKKKSPPKPPKASVEKPSLVSQQVWDDLIVLRKAKKAPLTQTAWDRAFKEILVAQKATGHPVEQIVSEWVSAGWQGFNSGWYLNRAGSKPAIDRKTDKLAVNNNWENASQPTEIKSTVTFEEFMGEA